MSRKDKPLPLLEHVTITDVAAEGKALAKVDDMVVFVPFVVPGDVVDLQVRRKKHSYAEAEAVKFHQLSPLRSQPFCRHFGLCGGCKWQCLKYEEQLKAKQKQVYDNLTRIGKIELPPMEADNALQGRVEGFHPILGSEHTRAYRNKLEFTFSNKRWLTYEEISQNVVYENMNAVGFHIPDCFDKVLSVDECFLMDDVNNRIRNGIRDYAYDKGLSFFDLRQQTGLLRNMMIRIAEHSDGITETMLLLQLCTNEMTGETDAKGRPLYREIPSGAGTPLGKQIEELMEYVTNTFPEITSLLYVVNNKANDTIGDLEVHVVKGEPFIMEEMEGLRFKVGPKSFYQTNSQQAYNLYKVARTFAGLTGNELVYDLYTGTGTIANFIARSCRKVIGIEYVPEAIEDAKVNASLNGLDNTLFFAGDMKDILTEEFIRTHGRPDVIITDPPRAGMHADVVNVILQAEPERIVYVSCNPASQARDLQMLCEKYRVVGVQPVDMFPHTQHVENVVLLHRKDDVDVV
ncbi:MAG: 23S rRNA (uracil(1939)-C(5))-methyltransferase RlmD [Bacteroidaceae bacterium]|nr:23S rRNA (uracil(1939)-C(5))-methyltransferase RlmD [Bacteroidaceae bacterium]